MIGRVPVKVVLNYCFQTTQKDVNSYDLTFGENLLFNLNTNSNNKQRPLLRAKDST